jgi:hypothetical protein
VKHIPGMSESDATIYFMSYKTLLQEIDAQNSNATGMYDPNVSLQQYQVDVRCFGLFIALQLYS